ncbi:MAG: hypothetical protein WC262_08680 [Bacteroidales bacterium]|jgi:hypothetical protein
MFKLSIPRIGLAIGIGIILSFFFIAMTVPQTVEQPVIEITPVPTPEPETTPIAITTGMTQTDEMVRVEHLAASVMFLCEVMIIAFIIFVVCGLIHTIVFGS